MSYQPMPILVAVLSAVQSGAAQLLAYSPERERETHTLLDVLRRVAGGRAAIEAVPFASAYDLSALHRDFSALAAAHPEGLSVNLTGSSKLATLIAAEVFSRPVDRRYYVLPDSRHVLWIDRLDGDPGRIEALAVQLSLRLILNAHGVDFDPTTPIQRPDADSCARLREHHHHWAIRAGELARAGKKPRTAREVGGKWLEEYLLGVLGGIVHDPSHAAHVRDWSGPFRLLRVQSAQRLPNEIDGALVWDDRLFLFECKTGADVAKDWGKTLMQLSRLAQSIGGFKCRVVVVTNFALSRDAVARARMLDVEYVDARNLVRLERELLRILGVETGPIRGGSESSRGT